MKKKIRIYSLKLNKDIMLLLGLVVLLIVLAIHLYNSQVLDIFYTLSENIIVVDAGHGGIDGGAGKKNDVLEKNINLEISKKLKKELLVEGFEIIMTREDDISLEDFSAINSSRYRRDLDARKGIINNNEPLAFVSIHCNSSKRSSARGIIIYYYPDSVEGERLAKCISESVDENFYGSYLNDDKLRTEILTDNFFILRETEFPGVLVEVGFITNPEESRLLREEEYQQNLARAIKKGIVNYLE